MNILTAIAILLGDDSFLSNRMKEASKTIEAEALKENSFLCKETISALKVLKNRRVKSEDKFKLRRSLKNL